MKTRKTAIRVDLTIEELKWIQTLTGAMNHIQIVNLLNLKGHTVNIESQDAQKANNSLHEECSRLLSRKEEQIKNELGGLNADFRYLERLKKKSK